MAAAQHVHGVQIVGEETETGILSHEKTPEHA
jgi:hypothetical protein